MRARTRGSTAVQNSGGMAYAASSRQPSAPRSNQWHITSTTRSATAALLWLSVTRPPVPLEVLVVRLVLIRLPVEVEQLRRGRVRPVAQRLLEGRVLASDVVEDPVEHHPNPPSVGSIDQCREVRLVAEPAVDRQVVDGVVAV